MGSGPRVFIQSHYTCQEILGGKLLRVIDKYKFDMIVMTPCGTDIKYSFFSGPVDLMMMMN